MSNEQGQKGRGCFFYGCLTLVILLLVGAVGTYFAARYAINKVLTTYTDTKPITLPRVEVSTREAESLQARVKAFQTAFKAGAGVEPLVLTEREINALIATSPDLKQFKDKVYVAIAGDQIKGQISIPLETIGLSKLQGRYLNGAGAFKVTLENGVLIVTLQSLQVKGKEIPEQFLAQIRKENLAKDVYRDPKNAEFIGKLESIVVKDGRIMVKAREAK